MYSTLKAESIDISHRLVNSNYLNFLLLQLQPESRKYIHNFPFFKSSLRTQAHTHFQQRQNTHTHTILAASKHTHTHIFRWVKHSHNSCLRAYTTRMLSFCLHQQSLITLTRYLTMYNMLRFHISNHLMVFSARPESSYIRWLSSYERLSWENRLYFRCIRYLQIVTLLSNCYFAMLPYVPHGSAVLRIYSSPRVIFLLIFFTSRHRNLLWYTARVP